MSMSIPAFNVFMLQLSHIFDLIRLYLTDEGQIQEQRGTALHIRTVTSRKKYVIFMCKPTLYQEPGV